MTAILKDWKGFTRSLDLPYQQPRVCLPIYHRTSPIYELVDYPSKAEVHEITFIFKDWINKEYKIALYEQET